MCCETTLVVGFEHRAVLDCEPEHHAARGNRVLADVISEAVRQTSDRDCLVDREDAVERRNAVRGVLAFRPVGPGGHAVRRMPSRTASQTRGRTERWRTNGTQVMIGKGMIGAVLPASLSVTDLERELDTLFQAPFAEFVGARNGLRPD
jgi:hypothetical protein